MYTFYCDGGIIEEDTNEWLLRYLALFNAFIKPGVKFDDLNALEFSILNIEKSNRRKLSYKLPHNVETGDSNDIPEVIMVSWKK